METIDEQLIATGRWFHVSYNPNLDGRDMGDEFDYPAADHHWSCVIVIDEESEAHGAGDTEVLAKAAALQDYRNQIN